MTPERKEYVDKWRRDNSDKLKANRKRYNKKHPEKAKAQKRVQRTRKLARGLCQTCASPRMSNNKRLCRKHWIQSLITNALGKSTDELVNRFDRLLTETAECPYTGEKLIPGINCSLDHMDPASRFSESADDPDNLEWISLTANLAKGPMTPGEFVLFCSIVSSKACARLNPANTTTYYSRSAGKRATKARK